MQRNDFKRSNTRRVTEKLTLKSRNTIIGQTATILPQQNSTHEKKTELDEKLRANDHTKSTFKPIQMNFDKKQFYPARRTLTAVSLSTPHVTDSNIHNPSPGSSSGLNSIYSPSHGSNLGHSPNPFPKSSNIKVVIRFRPLNTTEEDFMKDNVGFLTPEFIDDTSVAIKNDPNSTSTTSSSNYRFDKVFDTQTTQETMYEKIGRETILDVCNGYNGTIFTYGQSGSGKTHTMYGSDILDDTNRGIIPRLIENLFQIIEDPASDNIVYQLKFSILQIYKEVVYDLLTGDKDLKIKENTSRGIYVDGLSEFSIDNPDTFYDLLRISQENRMVAGTKLNQNSSRSHTIFILEVNQTNTKLNISKRGILNLVDLAGSEKIKKTGAVGETLEEAKKINLSLSALGNVIHALTSNSDHIPYRDSKLTRILQESLGGNYKTTLIVTCSPHSYHLEETTSSLKFAQRAKSIKNKVRVNIKLSYEELQKIIVNLKIELELANKQIVYLNNLIKGNSNVGENMINLINSQNVRSIVQKEIRKSNNKLIQLNGEVNEDTQPNQEVPAYSNVNFINNTSSNCNIIISPEPEDLEKLAKKLRNMNRKTTFQSNVVKNKLMSLFDFADLKNKIMTEDGVSSLNDFNSDDDSESKPSAIDERLKQKDEKIKELEMTVKKLQEKLEQKERIARENHKDLIFKCKENYEAILKEIAMSKGGIFGFHKSSFSGKDENEIHKDNALFDIPVVDIDDLIHKTDKTILDFEQIVNRILKDMNYDYRLETVSKHLDSSRIKETIFNKEKLKMFLDKNYLQGDKQEHSSLGNLFSTFRYKFTMELTEAFNQNLAKQNKITNKINSVLMSLLEEMITLNQNIIQRISTKNKIDDSHKNSMDVGIGFKPSFKEGEVPTSTSPIIKRKRIESFVTKQNVGLIRTVNAQRKNTGFTFDLNKFQNIEEEHNEDDKLGEGDAYKIRLREDTKKSLNSMNGAKMFDFSNNIILKHMERCSIEFETLKEFVIKSFKENSKIEESFKKISSDIRFTSSKINDDNFASSSNHNVVQFKHHETPDNSIEELHDINIEDRKLLGFNLGFKKETFPKMALLSKIEEKDESEMLSDRYADHPKRNKNSSIPYTTSSLSDRSRIITDKSIKTIEQMLSKYSSTGTASRKFDGINFKLQPNKKLKIVYESGLNCSNYFPSPTHRKLEKSMGDNTVMDYNEDDIGYIK